MNRPARALLLAVAVLTGLLALVALPTTTPPASAAEPTAEGNYVALAKPVRVVNQVLGAGRDFPFDPTGVTGVPRAGTTGVVLAVTGSKNATGTAMLQVYAYTSTGWKSHWVDAVMLYDGEPSPVTNTVTLPVDENLTGAKQLAVGEAWDGSGATVQVDVVGYYTKNAVGGGFVSVRDTKVFDTRDGAGTAIPAGGSVTKTVTGGIVPNGAGSISMDLVATNITQPGGIVAVPAGTDTSANPVMRFRSGGGIHSNLVVSKIGTNGQVTFKNTSTATVHLVARAVGYTTSSPKTGGGWRPIRREEWEGTIAANGKKTVQLTDGFFTPASGVGGIFVNLNVWGTTGSGSLRISPSGQATVATSLMYYNGMTTTYRHRQSGAILTPGTDGKVVIENLGAKGITLTITTNAYFTVPTEGYASGGGRPDLAVAHTSSGPCYAYLDPSTSIVKTGCATDDGDHQVIYAPISPAGHTFAGPVSVVARAGDRYVVTARHVPDGEVWTWELPHSTAAPTATAVRSFHYVKTPVVTASLPDGKPVGFTTDAEGRVWAIDLDIQAPEQPQWKQLDVPALAPADELAAVSTPAGIRLAATTASGDVVTGLYSSLSSTSLGWQSLGATGARGKVAMAVDTSGLVGVTVYGPGDTASSGTIAPTGQLVDGWHPVNTTYGAKPVQLAGNPTMVYDPQYDEHWILFRSDENGSGSLYRIREDAPDSGTFTDPVVAFGLGSMGIGSDVTAWDYRTDAPPPYRRWSFAFFDTAYGMDGGTFNYQ